jgi:hypothetical protein
MGSHRVPNGFLLSCRPLLFHIRLILTQCSRILFAIALKCKKKDRESGRLYLWFSFDLRTYRDARTTQRNDRAREAHHGPSHQGNRFEPRSVFGESGDIREVPDPSGVSAPCHQSGFRYRTLLVYSGEGRYDMCMDVGNLSRTTSRCSQRISPTGVEGPWYLKNSCRGSSAPAFSS